MNATWRELRRNPLSWLLTLPIVVVAERRRPEAHTALFLPPVAATIPLAALVSRAMACLLPGWRRTLP